MTVVQGLASLSCAPRPGSASRRSIERRKRRGYAVLAARESRGWSLEECSASSGFSVRQIMAWERGIHGLTLESLSRLARGYGMKHEEVITIVMGGRDEVGSRSGQVR
ncbi:helix-turn-helix domain-containing protein [Asaia sp. HN010]|uniref:helix-turn-helix domain-containing protein n=1 Tax=Asaia sp. HN010 TaxID=3081233 RepID=UPI0038D1D958